MMLAEEMERLFQNEPLFELLCRYATGDEPNQELWRCRIMILDGASAEEVRRLHGELLAYEWIEQNTGLATPGTAGGIANCYRATSDGRRALRQVQAERAAAPAPAGTDPTPSSSQPQRAPGRGGAGKRKARSCSAVSAAL